MVDYGGVIRRHELADRECELLAPLIPRAMTGRPRVEDRQVINGMVYKIRTGISWRDLPERYGAWKTVCTRFRRYALDGVFTRALQQIQARADAAGDVDWLVQIDSTIVRAHQHAAATGRKGGIHQPDEPDDHALGRSRGGLTTRIHLACDSKSRPLAILLTPGQHHDSICARPILERIRPAHRPRPTPVAGPTRSSRTRPTAPAAHTIPEKTDQQRHRHNRGRRGGRPPAFDRQIYRRRTVVERCFNRLKGFRGIATRYDKTAASYETAVRLTSFLL
ncbi:IS5 family transposase [Streptomyces sp. NBC_01619]|uniref:IS5 family transposase n=1 Tax=Streptomyces sp. NBC_01619 TaxID=2975901 RepID=UPI002258EBC0|nr:IS5 family transposase [Streptomyces sp. NBC_01619]MCX4515804.1 IS5 family transposase [Streptomyces sp. NBC_01619]